MSSLSHTEPFLPPKLGRQSEARPELNTPPASNRPIAITVIVAALLCAGFAVLAAHFMGYTRRTPLAESAVAGAGIGTALGFATQKLVQSCCKKPPKSTATSRDVENDLTTPPYTTI